MSSRTIEVSFEGRADTVSRLLSDSKSLLKGVPHQESNLKIAIRLEEIPEAEIDTFIRELFRAND